MQLLDFYLPVFKQILQMTVDPALFDNYQQSRQTCINLLDLSILEASQQNICEEEKEAAQLAVIAWLDETVLRSMLSWRQYWQRELLQRKYLNITVAGEHFFTRLNQLEPTHVQARQVFLFCLQQGFQGQYSSPDDQRALEEVIAEQRRLCLPTAWQTWPNEAAIVPARFISAGTMTQRLHPLICTAIGILLLYTTLYFFLYYYMF